MTADGPSNSVRFGRQRVRTGDREPRRAVELSGFGLLADGTTFGLTVLDLTYDGCKVETTLALIPGLRLKISITGLGGALDAAVRWYDKGRAGLQFSPDEPSETVLTPREHERVSLQAELSLRRQGRQNYLVRLFDLTPRGCRVEFVEGPRLSELLWVKFEGLDALEATVRWIDGAYGGLEFVRPIYLPVYEMLLKRLQH